MKLLFEMLVNTLRDDGEAKTDNLNREGQFSAIA